MSLLADLLSTVFERRYRAGGPAFWDDRPVAAIVDDLVSSRGEVSGLALARQILERFESMEDADKLAFFRHLATEMDIDPDTVRDALSAYEAAPDGANYRAFIESAEPMRQELIRRLNQVPGATGKLVAMRHDLLRLAAENGELLALDLDFRHLFASWFNRGFLVLRPINWESPAHILEKIIAYEAVHAIDSWDDLRRRLQPADRRCFAFFHPSMPDEPLIFVEIALTRGIPSSIQDVLSEERAEIDTSNANTAVFYSISNCQEGLAGVSFGNSLIKQVAADLSAELPSLRTFVTLSPIPGMARWLADSGRDIESIEAARIPGFAAHYLLLAKRSDGLPLDPVARFHLGNGALVHAIHADADTSPKGQAQSGGAMVNYRYDLSKISQNHERYATKQIVAASSQVRALSRTVDKAAA